MDRTLSVPSKETFTFVITWLRDYLLFLYQNYLRVYKTPLLKNVPVKSLVGSHHDR